MAIITTVENPITRNAAIARSKPIPGPKPWPVLGAFGNQIPFFLDPIGVTTKLFKEYGDFYVLVQGGGTRLLSPLPQVPMTVFTRRPDDLRQMIQADTYEMCGPSGIFYPVDSTPRKKVLNRWAGGLWSVHGEEHRDHRRMLMPAFHKKRIESYRDDMVRLTNDSIASWEVDKSHNTFRDMLNLARRIAVKTLFGQDSPDEDNSVAHKIEESYAIYSSPLTLFFQHDIPGTRFNRFLNIAWEVDASLHNMAAQRRKDAHNMPDVLSLLLTAQDEKGDSLTEDDVVGHIFLIYAGAHETISSLLSWTLLLLSQHPKVYASVVDELDSVLKGEAPTVEQLAKLPLLERVIKESLRILTPAPLRPRIALHDTMLGDYFIPAGSEVFSSIYAVHHDPDLYPDPETFNPDRWLSINPSPYEYHPFGAGVRMCLGQPFAMMSTEVVLAILLQKYRFECIPGTVVNRKWGITMSPGLGFMMNVRSQDREFNRGVGGIKGNLREMVNLPE